MEKTGCKIICGAPTTLAVKGFMMRDSLALTLFAVQTHSHFTLLPFTFTLTAGVVGAPQVTSQPFSSIFSALHCPLGLAELQACPFPDVVFLPLPLSALSSSPFHCALQDGFGQT